MTKMASTSAAIASRSHTPDGSSSSDDIIDSTTPFLSSVGSQNNESTNSGRRFVRRQPLRDAARLIRRASSRRMMREPSILVRETAAEQLEERQNDWAYSKPVVILDIIWNLAFVAVAVTVLVLSRNEQADVPLRLWIVGYAFQCVLHMVCVWVEYRRRQRRPVTVGGFSPAGRSVDSDGNSSSPSRGDSGEYVSLAQFEEDGTSIGIISMLSCESSVTFGTTFHNWEFGTHWIQDVFTFFFRAYGIRGYACNFCHNLLSSVAKHVESVNTMFSFIWWIMGFYWVSAGGQALARSSPQLYWLCIIFLGFDVFFVVFCVALACVIGIAVCCCLPCIIAILYAVADQEGASKEDVEQLSKFKFRRVGSDEKLAGDAQEPLGGIMTECGTDSPTEHVLSKEDAECCICLSSYDDGVELRELPCGHHFHSACVDKWLYINATCPLCKYNILKSSRQDREEV